MKSFVYTVFVCSLQGHYLWASNIPAKDPSFSKSENVWSLINTCSTMSFNSPQQSFCRFYRPSWLVEKKMSVTVPQTGQPLPSSLGPPQSSPHPPPVNHPPLDKPPPRGFYTRTAWQEQHSVCVCAYCMWVGGVCQSGYPLRLSKRLMGNLLHGPNHRLSLSFQQISLF